MRKLVGLLTTVALSIAMICPVFAEDNFSYEWAQSVFTEEHFQNSTTQPAGPSYTFFNDQTEWVPAVTHEETVVDKEGYWIEEQYHMEPVYIYIFGIRIKVDEKKVIDREREWVDPVTHQETVVDVPGYSRPVENFQYDWAQSVFN